ncbi:glycine/sarcosine/betaine reductase selenoprotein B family protein [Neobacillus sp. FSL H8-0543]|uniref:glycine/sarcosine/betaine reductase selenoprotein B family protein n=1 Tax=Neobacillus sp. FSL H8-0543 TaxID=2954672 RepID=UPI0031583878
MTWKNNLKAKITVQMAKYIPAVYNRFSLSQTKKMNTTVETKISKPLSECRVALITSAGVHLKEDEPFNVLSNGDYSYRIIPADTDIEDLEVTHIYYDTKSAKIDKSIVFPLVQLREFAHKGIIGSVSNTNIGLNGGTLNQIPHEEETAPKVIRELIKDKVDIALLTPG